MTTTDGNFSLVGLLIGIVLTLLAVTLSLPFYLQGALVVAFWAALTGGLHLDGLADCADAWVGGAGEREKTLHLLKDPLCGAMAVIALVLFLLCKTAALSALFQLSQWSWLWTVPVIARLALLPLFLSTTYVRREGLGEVLSSYFPRPWAWRLLAVVILLFLMILPLSLFLAFFLTSVIVLCLLRHTAIRRLNGFTGDVAGAAVELLELALLVAITVRG